MRFNPIAAALAAGIVGAAAWGVASMPIPVAAPPAAIRHTAAGPAPKRIATLASRDVDCVASAIWHEARGEPRVGQIAVAEVVINRTVADRWPARACAVVAQSGQFSFVTHGVVPGVPSADRPRMRAIARDVAAGRLSSGLERILFFHAAGIHPRWRLRYAGRIGGHMFYA